MPRPVVISQTGTGQSPWANLDTWAMPFNLSINCTVSGTVTYNVETTNSDYLTAGTTVNVVTAVNAASTTQQYATTTPARAWRINITAGTGTVTAEAIQAGLGQ